MESLDHVVINVLKDMEAASAAFTSLGFRLTPRGHHTLGSINHLMVVPGAYLELVGVPETGRQRAEILQGAKGIDGFVLKSSDAEQTARVLGEAGLSPAEPVSFSRPVTLDGQEHEARFRTVKLPSALLRAGRVYFCQHLTPDFVWRAEWMDHPNGFCGFDRLTVEDPDPSEQARHYALLAGSAVRETPEGYHVPCAGIDLHFRRADAPRFARLGLRFSRLDELAGRVGQVAGARLDTVDEGARLLRLPALNVDIECRSTN